MTRERVDLTITHGKRTFQHNTNRWRVATNKHPESSGWAWGWIEGAWGNNTWSDNPDSAFTSKDAREVCRKHNEWLEAQKPLTIRLIEARSRAAKAAKLRAEMEERYHKARIEHQDAESEVMMLENKILESTGGDTP